MPPLPGARTQPRAYAPIISRPRDAAQPPNGAAEPLIHHSATLEPASLTTNRIEAVEMVDMATLVRGLLDDSVASHVEVKSREKWRQVNHIRRRSRFVVSDAG